MAGAGLGSRLRGSTAFLSRSPANLFRTPEKAGVQSCPRGGAAHFARWGLDPGLRRGTEMGDYSLAWSSRSIALTIVSSVGAMSGEKRATTSPSRPIRNFSKFHSTSGSGFGVMP
jgi:hypothetical protein